MTENDTQSPVHAFENAAPNNLRHLMLYMFHTTILHIHNLTPIRYTALFVRLMLWHVSGLICLPSSGCAQVL